MIRATTKARAKVWKITPTEKYIDLTLSTSSKGQDGTYTNSRWYARAIGHAMNALRNIKVGDVITIKDFQISNVSKKLDNGEWKSYFDMLLTDADVGFTNDSAAPAVTTPPPVRTPAATKPTVAPPTTTGNDLPW